MNYFSSTCAVALASRKLASWFLTFKLDERNTDLISVFEWFKRRSRTERFTILEAWQDQSAQKAIFGDRSWTPTRVHVWTPISADKVRHERLRDACRLPDVGPKEWTPKWARAVAQTTRGRTTPAKRSFENLPIVDPTQHL